MGISDLTNIKGIIELIAKGSNLKAEEELMKYRELILELTDENMQLKQKISELEEKLNLKENIEKSDKGLFVKKHDGTKDGPYCVRCHEVEEKLISLHKIKDGLKHHFECPECKNIYDKDDNRFTLEG